MPQPKQFSLKKTNAVPSLANSIRVLRSLEGKTLSALNLIMWPPLGELEEKYIIFSCNLMFTDNSCVLIDTDGNQYSILVQQVKIPEEENFPLSSLYNRIDYWRNVSDDEVTSMKNEVFYTDENSVFQKFIGRQIRDVILLNKGIEEINPYGLRLVFDNNIYLYSFSNTYGNSIQTDDFMNHVNPITLNDFLGETIEIQINEVVIN